MKSLVPLETLPVKEPEKPTKKQKRALAEAQAFAKFGVHALRVKSSVLTALGAEAEVNGIKHLGQGKVIVASSNAEEAIAYLGKLAEKLASKDCPDFDLIIEVMRLQKEWNAQLITTAQVHLNMAKAAAPMEGPQLNVPFPAGAPLMIAVGKAPSTPHNGA